MVVCRQCGTTYDEGAAVRFCGRCGGDLGGGGEERSGSPSSGRSTEAAVAASAEPEAADPWHGRVVDGRYHVLGLIGQGGMGSVYRVEHVRMGKVAAMKVLHRELAGDREAARRFRREAQAVSQLNHPNIVQTFDFGQWGGALYLVMEYVKGDDLGTIIKRDGPMPFARAAPLFIEICGALAEAHEAGIVHRDLKPENIVRVQRRDREHAKVLDFGLAKLRERQELAEITARHSLVGTPYYMSPEQVRAEPLDPRSDIYSLGATLYRVLTGEPPFQAATAMGVMTRHLTEPLQPPSGRAPDLDIPVAADEIIVRAMDKDRARRYGSAAEVQRALEAALTAQAPAPQPGSARAAEPVTLDAGERLRREDFDAFERSLRRRKLLAGLVLPAVLAAGAAGAWTLTRSVGQEPRDEELEPNDRAASSNVLPRQRHVHGTLGGAREQGTPDLDYFLIPAGAGRRSVKAQLDPVPGVDMLLELFSSDGQPLARANQGGPGEREILPATEIGPKEAFLLVREVWIEGTPATDNATDHYALYVDWTTLPDP